MAGEWRNYSRRFAKVLKVTGGGRGDEEGKFVLTARFIVFPSRIGAASSSSSEELLITLDIRRVMKTGLRIRCRWFHRTFKLEFTWKRNKYRDLHSHKYCDWEQLLILNYSLPADISRRFVMWIFLGFLRIRNYAWNLFISCCRFRNNFFVFSRLIQKKSFTNFQSNEKCRPAKSIHKLSIQLSNVIELSQN